MVSWQYWHYCECDDPTTSGTGVQAVVLDPSQPPEGANLRQDKLDVLSRAYPQVVAGTPDRLRLRPGDAALRPLAEHGRPGRHLVRPASPRRPRPGLDPRDRGLRAAPALPARLRAGRARGAASPPRPGRGSLASPPAPGGSASASPCAPREPARVEGPECVVAGAKRQRLRLKLSPRSAPAGERTCFRAAVRTAGGAALRGARVRVAGARARSRTSAAGLGSARPSGRQAATGDCEEAGLQAGAPGDPRARLRRRAAEPLSPTRPRSPRPARPRPRRPRRGRRLRRLRSARLPFRRRSASHRSSGSGREAARWFALRGPPWAAHITHPGRGPSPGRTPVVRPAPRLQPLAAIAPSAA